MTLSIRNIKKRVNDDLTVQEVSFEAERGEILGIFSIDHDCRSTLMGLVSGSIKPDGGQIVWENTDLTATSKSGRGFCDLTHEEKSRWGGFFNAKNPSTHKGRNSFSEDLHEALAIAESVLLVESKFALFNRQFREKIVAEFKEIVQEKQLCVLISTNNFEEIFAICDRAAIFDGCKLVQTGTPREVYESPNSVAVILATGQCNIISAQRVSSSKAETPQFITIDGEHLVFTDKLSKTDLAPINQNVNLAIRPEHISISFGASFPEDNLLKAQITDVKYLGATTLLHLNAGGLELKALVLRLVGLSVGDECMVGLPPDRILVLKD